MTTYFPDQGCYRCIHPNPPNPSTVTNCSEGGVIGAVCGVIGSIQATETLKILANNNPEERNYSLKGKMILYDGLRGDMRTIRLRGKQTGCKLCGTKEITKLIGKAFLRDSDKHQYNWYRNGSNMDQDSVPCKVCTLLRIHLAKGRRDSMFPTFRMGPAASGRRLCEIDRVLFRVTKSRVLYRYHTVWLPDSYGVQKTWNLS